LNLPVFISVVGISW